MKRCVEHLDPLKFGDFLEGKIVAVFLINHNIVKRLLLLLLLVNFNESKSNVL